MIFVLNLRKDEVSSVRFSEAPHWSFLTDRAAQTAPIPAENALGILAGKKICVLICGYNSPQPFMSYFEIVARVSKLYQHFIFVLWPNAKRAWAFLEPSWATWSVFGRADKAGRNIQRALFPLHDFPLTSIDIEAHSLGNRVALSALDNGLIVNNLLMCGAAVDNESIQEGYEWYNATGNAKTVLVFHSHHDEALLSYIPAKWDRPLGLRGPEHPERCRFNVEVVDCSETVKSHGDYKRSPQVLEWWKRMV